MDGALGTKRETFLERTLASSAKFIGQFDNLGFSPRFSSIYIFFGVSGLSMTYARAKSYVLIFSIEWTVSPRNPFRLHLIGSSRFDDLTDQWWAELERSLQALPLLTSYQSLIFRPRAIFNGRGCFERAPFSTEEPPCRLSTPLQAN